MTSPRRGRGDETKLLSNGQELRGLRGLLERRAQCVVTLWPDWSTGASPADPRRDAARAGDVTSVQRAVVGREHVRGLLERGAELGVGPVRGDAAAAAQR